MKNLAIDFDDTFTANPAFWLDVIRIATKHGITCYIVTCRRDTPENREIVYGDRENTKTGLPWSRHIFTNLGPKRDFCIARGLHIDVWADDDPGCVLFGK